VAALGCAAPALAAPEPMAAKYLYEGKLAEGEKAIKRHLEAGPDDAQAQFGLGAIQFLRAFEKLGGGLYKYGLRTKRFPGMPTEWQKLLPENDKAEKIDHKAFRKMVQDFVDKMDEATKTLARVKDDKVKMPLEVGKIKLDLWGRGAPVSAAMLFRQFELKDEAKAAEKLVVGFDRGDVSWLRGYCHFFCALGEVFLSLDTKEAFDATAHRFFAKADTPHKFLLEDYKDFEGGGFFGWGNDPNFWIDAIQFVYHLFDMPIGEPARLKKALAHLESMVDQGEEMWKHIMAETDDDNEWIPNPKQTGVLKITVTNEMVNVWRNTVLVEAKAILAGKKLIPFWRGKPGARGLNLRKVFLNPPKRLDIFRWVQGTAAAPYLEKGDITKLADLKEMNRIDRVFGGANFFGFALWFN
jgi:hypothetical protein